MREAMLILHFIGLAMALGTSFSFMFLAFAMKKMEETEAKNFFVKALTITTMGHIGLGLLIISGGYLMTPHWSTLTDRPLLLAKLVLVVVLLILITMLSRIARLARNGDTAQLQKSSKLGPMALLTGLSIVVLAVLEFH